MQNLQKVNNIAHSPRNLTQERNLKQKGQTILPCTIEQKTGFAAILRDTMKKDGKIE